MYSTPLFRPPSEARSLIIQVTEGCSHNKCRFCTMYKNKSFRVRSIEEIIRHIKWLKSYYVNNERIFLADGNVFCLKTEKLINILELVKKEFPWVKRISSYSGPLDILRKSDEELKLIKGAGLDLLYMGVESGSDKVLSYMKKGVTKHQMIEAGQKAIKADFKLSCMIISGLGGTELMKEHAIESAEVISDINPNYFSLLRLVVEDDSELTDDIREGKFHLLNPMEVIDENIIILENINLSNCIFRANHVSNYVNLAGTLNQDRDLILSNLKRFRNDDSFRFMINDML